MPPRAWIVVDLGFGDAGKGTITDALVRHTGARWVVRYNGGAQAGHNVVTDDGRHHTFSQFGSGTFVPGVMSYLAPKVIFHPSALLYEAEHLARVGVTDAMARLRIAQECRVTTPFHQAAGRIRELQRGDNAHGSCGVGVGETVRDALENDHDVLRAGDLHGLNGIVLSRLERIRLRLLASLSTLPRNNNNRDAQEWQILEDPNVALRWLELIDPVRETAHILPDKEMHQTLTDQGDLVFEGAQGVLLDEWYGFHPHTTWSACTSLWAQEWLETSGLPHTPFRLGVLRTYATRHGQGPLPSEDSLLGPLLPEPHNDCHGWQGQFRVGWPDPGLARYAIAANHGIDAMALTHLDYLANVAEWQYTVNHGNVELPLSYLPCKDLKRQSDLGISLTKCKASIAPIPASSEAEYIAWFERELGTHVIITSNGPTANDKQFHFERALTF